MNKSRTSNWLTLGSLAALALAALCGSLFMHDPSSTLLIWSDLLGKIWIILLLFLVIPLVCAYVFHTAVSVGQDRSIARVGFFSLKLHVAIMILGVGFSLVTTLVMLDVLPVAKISGLLPNDVMGLLNTTENVSPLIVLLNQLDNLQGQLGMLIIGLMIVSLFIGFTGAFWSVTAIVKWKSRAELLGARALRWLNLYFLSLPFAVFILTLSLMVKSGAGALGLVVYFMLGLSFALIAYTFILYLIVRFGARMSMLEFGRGILPAQMSAISTRSSMATIPAMILACEEYFDLPAGISSFLVTFNTTLFRVSKSVSNTFEYIFLCFIFDISLEPITFLSFISLQLLSSFITPGIPSGSKFSNLPIFLAFGIPMEGYILIKSVDAIPDIFKTIINVTEVMALVMLVKNRIKMFA